MSQVFVIPPALREKPEPTITVGDVLRVDAAVEDWRELVLAVRTVGFDAGEHELELDLSHYSRAIEVLILPGRREATDLRTYLQGFRASALPAVLLVVREASANQVAQALIEED